MSSAKKPWLRDPIVGSRLLNAAFLISAFFLLVLFLHSRNLFDPVIYYRNELGSIPPTSSVRRLLTKYPGSLNFRELRSKLSLEYFEARSWQFHQQTQGLLREAQSLAVSHKLCPENGSKVEVLADKELGYNLESYLGQVYYLHLHDCLETSSGYEGSRAFFFFNPHHKLLQPGTPGTHIWDFSQSFNSWNAFAREWEKLSDEERSRFWNPIRTQSYPMTGLQWPPFARFYQNSFMAKLKLTYDRSVAIVSGKHYRQWNAPHPVNTFADPATLRPILDALVHNNYVVVYNRVRTHFGADAENGDALDPGDYDMINKEYSDQDVVTLEDLWSALEPQHGMMDNVLIFNMFQLLIYQQAEVFVDTQGGGAVISSLMPGDHFILHMQGSELIEPEAELDKAWVYHRWWRHGGGRFFVYSDAQTLALELKGVVSAHKVLRDSNVTLI
eukprot:Gregarina_sp_Pseudo_9__3323@NODE_34_length_5483_cov_39_119581_g31_i0_p1_GENE_NODE_34_length_5483_cov_39_119581_g31_i0NODE_34_length_5483_cov_39_119581_g31_i0_p1_ORF_typecomplete_len443_score55_53Terminase_GpA/PF05876_12/0_15_NODE_34_length_5483_cov_39_119581_g31_i09372265